MAVTQRQGFLAAFGYRNYRYLWGSGIAEAFAIALEMLVVGWLILELTDSPFLVGLMAACRYAGMVLAPFCGTLADRFDRRRILIVTRAAIFVFVFILTALYFASLLEVWHIFTVVLVIGLLRTFSMIVNQAVIPDVLEKHHLNSAVGMQFLSMSGMMMLGPLIGGYLYEQIGVGGCFVVLGAFYLLSCLLILPLRLESRESPERQESVWKSLIYGFRYIVSDRSLLSLMLLTAVANFFVWTCVVSIMPVFARDILHVGASDLGWMLSAAGLGGLLGALVVAFLGRFSRKGRIPFLALITWSVLLVVMAAVQSFPVSIVLLVGTGVCQSLTQATFHVVLLTWTAEEVRARVMGIYTFSVGTSPFGSIFLGVLADSWGAATAIIISTLAAILLTIFIAFWAPELHRRE